MRLCVVFNVTNVNVKNYSLIYDNYLILCIARLATIRTAWINYMTWHVDFLTANLVQGFL